MSGTCFEDALPTDGDLLAGRGVHDLHQEPYPEGDHIFLGLEAAFEIRPGLLVYSEAEIDRHLLEQDPGHENKIPVVDSDVPTHGILDIGFRFGQGNIGSTSLRTFVDEVEPAGKICGHCHPFGGRDVEEEWGTVLTVASHNSPGSDGRYGILGLDGSELEDELHTTEWGPIINRTNSCRWAAGGFTISLRPTSRI